MHKKLYVSIFFIIHIIKRWNRFVEKITGKTIAMKNSGLFF